MKNSFPVVGENFDISQTTVKHKNPLQHLFNREQQKYLNIRKRKNNCMLYATMPPPLCP